MRIILIFLLYCYIYPQGGVYYYRDHRIGLAVEPGTPAVQGDYYVDAVSGNDANDGLTTGTAWKTLSKVSGESFVPGDTILFNRGDTFQGTLTISSSGSSDNPIVYGAYGTGEKPIITTWADFPSKAWQLFTGTRWFDADHDNVHDAGEDKDYSDSTTVWYADMTAAEYPDVKHFRIKNNGTELAYGNVKDYYYSGDFQGANNNNDGTFFVCPERPFGFNIDDGTVYLRTDGTYPTSYYTGLTWSAMLDSVTGSPSSETGGSTIRINDVEHITLQDLDVQGGSYSTIAIINSSYYKLDSVDVQWYLYMGLSVGHLNHDNGAWNQVNDYGEIKHCSFESGDRTMMDHAADAIGLTFYGIYLMGSPLNGSTNHTVIDSNYFHGAHTNILVYQLVGGSAKYTQITNNTISGGENTYSKPVQLNGESDAGDDTADDLFTLIYRNVIDSVQNAIQISADSNYVCFNIFKNQTIATNIHASGGSGMAYSGDVSTDPAHNQVFNNTFVDIYDWALSYNHENNYSNNLIVNCNTSGYNTTAGIWGYINGTRGYERNNKVWYPSMTSSTDMIYWRVDWTPTYDLITVDEWNTYTNGDWIISGNAVEEGARTLLINADYTIPSGSIAENAGIDITTYLSRISDTDKTNYTITKDVFGNTITPATPNVGAIDNTP